MRLALLARPTQAGPAFARAFALASTFAATLVPGLAGAVDAAPVAATAATAATAAAADLYLDVQRNGRSTGTVMHFMLGANGLRASADDLRALGIEPELSGNARQQVYDLDQVRGLRYAYDPAAQSIDLRVSDALRTPFVVQTRPTRAPGAGSATPGAVVNYDLYARFGTGAQTALLSEVRLFDAGGVFSSTALARMQGSSRSLLRYDSTWTRADPNQLTTIEVGDFISRSLPWSRSIRMGGVEYRKNFDLRPDVLTYPAPQIGGSAVLPSNVALYVNQMQQYAGAVPDGPFVLDQVAGLNGAGQATLVTRDALGRDVATAISLYIDTRMLAPGLEDYALGAGFVRRHYGIRSFAYAPQPAVTASLRRGLSDWFTLEAHAEASTRLANGGAGLLARLGNGGVVNAALAASTAPCRTPACSRAGYQASVGYQYLASQFSIDVQSMRASAAYADLGSTEGTAVVRASDRVTINTALSYGQNLGFSYVGLGLGATPMARIAALAYGYQITPHSNLTVHAYRDLDHARTQGVVATLSMTLPGRMGASASSGSQSGARTRTLALARAGEVATSPGWSIQQGKQNGNHYEQAQAQYVGTTAQYSAALQRDPGGSQGALGITGSVVAMHDRVLAARQTGAAFALVSTGLPDVVVLHENRAVGRTDRYGDLLVPNLIPYAPNRLGIDAEALPLEVQVRQSTLEVVPQRQAGVLAALTVLPFEGATLRLVDEAGQPLPGGAAVSFGSGAAPSVVGYDGIVFVEHVKPDNALTLDWTDAGRARRCVVRFSHARLRAAPGALLGPLVCRTVKETLS